VVFANFEGGGVDRRVICNVELNGFAGAFDGWQGVEGVNGCFSVGGVAASEDYVVL
jgi:hypothetical protein